ncbi:D-2-hydroxyacid dehydrogenase [uncultured Thiothrix sp.]|uniref:D-2-hydroxyacid dehydrogenase n=1 Tax=uncultured Thiothrix sp. TaxID=223185 RepID=UPI002603559F|nr:D-2-hydroxyacid dehydrogenase [uncultured Thiothrix sp.]HMT92772.1 D-2-hydroxyacid dehydrogenase [Thiolinea sp.]
MPQTVFLDYASTSHNDLDLTQLEQACGTLTLWEDTNPETLLEHIGQAEVVISNKVLINASTLQVLKNQLKLICVAATGTNNVDLVAARALGISICNVRNYGSRSVAEHCISLIFALARQIPAYNQTVQMGSWQQSKHFCLLDYPITEIAGKTLGIIGYGTLGQATAELAAAIGMKIMIAERLDANHIRPNRVSIDELLAQADVISLHCPLNEQTKAFIHAKRLKQMKPSAFLINSARGGLIDEADLLVALQNGTIAGAGLDVLSIEPPTADNPLLWQSLPNLIITPHIAWASRKARQTLLNQLADIINSFQQGKLLNQVN